MSRDALLQAIEKVGSQAKLADILDVGQTAISNWLHRESGVPAERVLSIEAATGVSRHDLRPDLYPREIGRTRRAAG